MKISLRQTASILVVFLFFIIFSCANKQDKSISFYHWKNDTQLSEIENHYLQELKVEEIYLRFFDIGLSNKRKPYPISVIREIEEKYNSFIIVPVVFITNETIEKVTDIDELAEDIHELIDQMYYHHLKSKPGKIQIDCDWNESTRDKYFRLLEGLSDFYTTSATVRLHQVKYQDRTGVPPADEGTLMVYNIGDLKDTATNSIFSQQVLEQYINKESTYPLILDMALPIYFWGVLNFPNGDVKLINGINIEEINAYESLFVKIDEFNFQVKNGINFKGFYLPASTILHLEKVDFDEILNAKEYLESCQKLKWQKIMLYHLDEDVLNEYSLGDLKKIK